MKKNIFLKITIVAIIIILLVITYFVFFTKHDTLDDIGYLIDLKENVVLDDRKINLPSLTCHLDLLTDTEPWAKWAMLKI